MKKLFGPLGILGIILVLALLSTALTNSAPPAVQGNLSRAAFFSQVTATPQPKDVSEAGSTDRIVVMGGIIAMIVIIPILLRRKYWMQST
jgi:hypothetical protein